MAPRQVWLFQLGCWVALATAALHLAAHVLMPVAVDAHASAGLGLLAPPYVFLVPGIRQPTFLSVFNGLSVSFAISMVTVGLVGLGVVRHGADRPQLVRSTARALAVGTGLMLAVSILNVFSWQTFPLSTVALCFGMAAVDPEGHE